jgi:uncharacterized protein YecT (DUF1311 family)
MQTFTTTKRIAALAGGLLVAMGLLIGSQAHAQAGAACHANGSQDERNACAVQEFQEADSALNILYGDVMRILSAHERPGLRTDQSQWSRNRVAQCKSTHRADEARTDWNALYHRCLVTKIGERRAVLTHWLHHGEAPTQRKD